MRIAHFVQRYPPALGGSEAYFARLSEHLAAAGDDVTVFTTAAYDLDAFWSRRGRCLKPGVSVEEGVTVRRYRLWHCPGHRRLLKLLSFVPYPPWQRMAMSCNPVCWSMWRDAGWPVGRFDVVHASAFPYGWPLACGLRLARTLGVPYLVTPFLHLGDPEDPRDRTRRAYTSPALLSLLHAADRVFVQTEVERDGLLERGLPPEKLVLQGMGVDTEHCTGGDRQRARAEWGIGPDEVVIGHLANNSVEKGSVDLLRGAEIAWQRGDRFRLVLAGPEMPNFRSFWRNYRARDRVLRRGVLDEREKRDFFAGIDVFALPSRSDSFGLVLLEAWANRVPNLAYRAGGIAGVVRHEIDGLLVRCGDRMALAESINRLVNSAVLRQSLGAAGQARLNREFCWQDKLALVQKAYRDAILSRQTQVLCTRASLAPIGSNDEPASENQLPRDPVRINSGTTWFTSSTGIAKPMPDEEPDGL